MHIILIKTCCDWHGPKKDDQGEPAICERDKALQEKNVFVRERQFKIKGKADLSEIERLTNLIKDKQNYVKDMDNRIKQVKHRLQSLIIINPYEHAYKSDIGGIMYRDVPMYFTWLKDEFKWKIRENYFNTIGRIYAVSPSDLTGRFHLRILLHYVRSPTSYEELKVVDKKVCKENCDEEMCSHEKVLHKNYICETFGEACLERGLIENDKEYWQIMDEAKECRMPSAMRNLFVLLLVKCDVTKPGKLWDGFKDQMIDDLRKQYPRHKNDDEMLYKIALSIVLEQLIAEGKAPEKDYPSLPKLNANDNEHIEKAHESKDNFKISREMREKMNKEQSDIYDQVEQIILGNDDNACRCWFLYGAGGTGKSYVYIALYYLCLAYNKKVLTTAFTGIAATILPEGMTNHKLLKLPLDVKHDTTSGIQVNMPEADLLKEAFMIIWDEGTMSPKYVLDICDVKLREIMRTNMPFGNKIMMLGGDFRQLLPIKQYATAPEIIGLCIRYAVNWTHFNVVNLVKNMRANEGEVKFAQDLLDIGNGTANDINDKVALPKDCVIKKNQKLSKEIFKSLIDNKDWEGVSKCAILAPYTVETDIHNDEVLEMIQGKEKIYESVDSQDKDAPQLIAPEDLRSFNKSNFPPATLRLKENAIVILLRNLILLKKLCNGTRLRVKKMMTYSILCEIITDKKLDDDEKTIILPRITLDDDKNRFGCKLLRKQIPVKLAFGMTINKAQGQTLEKVGLDLTRPVFSHGQLYVGVSRVRSWDCLKIKLSDRQIENKDFKVPNIVYTEVLKDL